MKFLFLAASLLCSFAAWAGEQWIEFPNERTAVFGLPWFSENSPELWRLPKSSKVTVPAGVWNRAVAPDGGRICFVTDSSRLTVKVRLLQKSNKPCFLDAYLGNERVGSAPLKAGDNELLLFENKGRAPKEITLYLANNHEIRLQAIGLDAGATLKQPTKRPDRLPIVCYGSSVLQGTGAKHPSMTYPAILARLLKMDFVNLGFGGAGKAEPSVVKWVNEIEASCFILDLGKSYGDQDIQPYLQMLETIRGSHPKVPIFCITPIFSTKETNEPAYREKSERLRALMRDAAERRRRAGDKLVFTIEGLDLFGEADQEFFNDPLHPNDAGNERLAARLAPIVQKALSRAAKAGSNP